MRACVGWLGAGLMAAMVVSAVAQQKPADAPAPVVHKDAVLDAASAEVGRALFLRCFCAEDELGFDAAGHPQGAIKAEDWTLAGVNVQKVERKGAGEIELDGVRVAIRYATDRHEFDRHALPDDKMKIVIADDGDARVFQRALDAVFAVGIDLRLQHAMPEFWQHYFNPQMVWPKDELTGMTIATPGAVGAPADLTAPVVAHRGEASYSNEGSRDKVQGDVLLRMVVDANGVPLHVSIGQPLGYGLDARAVEAVRKDRFTPAMLAGKPVAANVVVREEFVVR
jgi:TonB family protein